MSEETKNIKVIGADTPTGKTTVVEDASIKDKILDKIEDAKEAQIRECIRVEKTGKHHYIASGELSKLNHKEVFRCICGKEIS